MRLYETYALEQLVKSRRVHIQINKWISTWNRTRTMNKTKVRVSPDLHDYCQAMTERVDDLRDDKLRIEAEAEVDVQPFNEPVEIAASEKAGLLLPPLIECLLPEFYFLENGETEGIVNILTSDLFGIASICVTLRDEAGNLLEKGYAFRDETHLGCWAYPPKLAPAVGSTVVVRAVATDALGGTNISETEVTLTDEYLRSVEEQMEQWKNR